MSQYGIGGQSKNYERSLIDEHKFKKTQDLISKIREMRSSNFRDYEKPQVS